MLAFRWQEEAHRYFKYFVRVASKITQILFFNEELVTPIK